MLAFRDAFVASVSSVGDVEAAPSTVGGAGARRRSVRRWMLSLAALGLLATGLLLFWSRLRAPASANAVHAATLALPAVPAAPRLASPSTPTSGPVRSAPGVSTTSSPTSTPVPPRAHADKRRRSQHPPAPLPAPPPPDEQEAMKSPPLLDL
jgi:hypothetical protein